MSNIDKRGLREAAEKATKGRWAVEFDDEIYSTDGVNHEQIAMVFSENEARDAAFIAAANPATVLALLASLEAAEKRIAELEANKCKPVMFIDGDISPADADKLAAVIREFNEETETPAARMARIIRENPHPTNMCDMPAAGIGVKGE